MSFLVTAMQEISHCFLNYARTHMHTKFNLEMFSLSLFMDWLFSMVVGLVTYVSLNQNTIVVVTKKYSDPHHSTPVSLFRPSIGRLTSRQIYLHSRGEKSQIVFII